MKALAPPEQAGTPAVRPARRGRYVAQASGLPSAQASLPAHGELGARDCVPQECAKSKWLIKREEMSIWNNASILIPSFAYERSCGTQSRAPLIKRLLPLQTYA